MTIHMTRRRMLAAAGGCAFAAPFLRCGPARAAEFSYKYASNLPAAHPLNLRAQEAADRIRADTGGRLDIQVFPNNQLGSDSDVLGQLRSGGVEFFTMGGVVLSTLVPASSINGIGFAFKDSDAVWRAMDGELGAHIRAEIAKRNLVVMEKSWDNGFRHITSASRPIVTPDDFRDFKVRVPPSPLWTSMFRAFGAAPISINVSELYSSLQTRIADGQENPLPVILTMKLAEVQKYCSLTRHMWGGYWFLANRKAWEDLPDDLRAVAERHINAGALAQREDIRKLDLSARTELEAKGIVFNEPDHEAFRDKLRKSGFYGEWRGRFGEQAWALLEKSAGKLP